MIENLTWQEIHILIKSMTTQLKTQKTVTRTIPRINYTELLGVIRNQTIFQHNQNININIRTKEDKIIIKMENKKNDTRKH